MFGVNQSTVAKWEKGARIGDEHIEAVAMYIDIPLEDALLLAHGRSAGVGSVSSKRIVKVPDTIRSSDAGDMTSDELIAYPFPLRDGRLLVLNLPPDLTKKEAMRLAAFIDSLAVG